MFSVQVKPPPRAINFSKDLANPRFRSAQTPGKILARPPQRCRDFIPRPRGTQTYPSCPGIQSAQPGKIPRIHCPLGGCDPLFCHRDLRPLPWRQCTLYRGDPAWPPTGLALVTLWAFLAGGSGPEFRLAPSAINVTVNWHPGPIAAGIAAGNTLEAVGAVLLTAASLCRAGETPRT